MEVTTKNIITFCLAKVIVTYFLYYFLQSFFNENLFAYPDWYSAYYGITGSYCNQTLANIFYSRLICLLNISDVSDLTPIFLASSINILISIGYFLLFKPYLNKKGQLAFLVVMIFHPYLAIYMPRFYTDIFGSIGIFIVACFSLKKIGINWLLIILSTILMNFRNSLIPVFLMYSILEMINLWIKERRLDYRHLLLIFICVTNITLYSGYIDAFFLIREPEDQVSFESIITKFIFLLGFREGIANDIVSSGGLFSFAFDEYSGYYLLQIILSALIAVIHLIGIIFSSKKLAKINLSIFSIYFYVIPTLLKVSFMRFLIPLLPVIIFGLCYEFFKSRKYNT